MTFDTWTYKKILFSSFTCHFHCQTSVPSRSAESGNANVIQPVYAAAFIGRVPLKIILSSFSYLFINVISYFAPFLQSRVCVFKSYNRQQKCQYVHTDVLGKIQAKLQVGLIISFLSRTAKITTCKFPKISCFRSKSAQKIVKFRKLLFIALWIIQALVWFFGKWK